MEAACSAFVLLRNLIPAPVRLRLAGAVPVAALAVLAGCSPATHPTDPFAPRAATFPAEGRLPDFRTIASDARHAVVDVVTTENTEDTGIPGFDDFSRGEGSGFVVSADGLVLTAAHVVRGAETVTVRLADRREFAASVVGMDLVTDVAVLRIAADHLPTVRLGDSARLRSGDWVLAIGSPFGFDHSASAGLVSAVDRAIPDEPLRFIQTDVPLNPGNSGGPLFDAHGEVVGINAQIFSITGGFQGISFAVPIDLVRQAAQQIVASGRALHGTLGVTTQDLDATLAVAFGLGAPDGALVVAVQDGGPGAKAGMREGDVVISADGRDVTSSGDLSTTVALRRPGDRLLLRLWRDGRAISVLVDLGDGSDDRHGIQVAVQGGNESPGLRLQRIQAHGTGASQRGLLVEGVSGRAARAGIRPGDILLAVGGQPADSVDNASAAFGPQPIAVLVQRGQERRYFALPPASAPQH